MSISRITRGLNYSVTFFPYWCVLQDLATKTTIGLGKQRGGLYYLVALASTPPTPKYQPSAFAVIATPSSRSHVTTRKLINTNGNTEGIFPSVKLLNLVVCHLLHRFVASPIRAFIFL